MKLNPKEKKRIEEKKIDVLIGKWRKNIINSPLNVTKETKNELFESVASTVEKRIDSILQKQYRGELKDMIIYIEQLLEKHPETNYDLFTRSLQEKFGGIILSSGINPLVLLKKILQAGQDIHIFLRTTNGGNHTEWKTEKMKNVVIISDVHYPYQMTIKLFPRPLIKDFESNKFHRLQFEDYICEDEVKGDE